MRRDCRRRTCSQVFGVICPLGEELRQGELGGRGGRSPSTHMACEERPERMTCRLHERLPQFGHMWPNQEDEQASDDPVAVA